MSSNTENNMPEDSDLIRKFQSGDENSFDKLVSSLAEAGSKEEVPNVFN